MNIKFRLQKPEIFGSGVKEGDHVFLSGNIHINRIQPTTLTLSIPFKPEKITKKTEMYIIKDSVN